jgi:hypothetical protein
MLVIETFFGDAGFSLNASRMGWQRMLGLAFGGGVGLGPSEEFAKVAAEIGSNRRSSVADFLNDGVFQS